MTAADAWFLYFEKPHAPLHIGSLQVFDGDIALEQTRRGMEERMHLIPRYRQRPVFPPLFAGHPTWEDDPDFSLDRHIREVVLPAPGTEEQLRATTAEVFQEMLPRDRPLWDIIVLRGVEGGRTGYVSRVHHCLVDGVSGIELMLAVLDLVPDPPPPTPPAEPWVPAPLPDAMTAWSRATTDAWARGAETLMGFQRDIFDPRGNVERIGQTTRAMWTAITSGVRVPSPKMWNRPVGSKRRVSFSTMSFQEVRAIRAELGGTVNDVVLTLVGGALGRYLKEHGNRLREGERVRVMTPVNVRKEAEQGDMGNRVSMMLPNVPLAIEDPVARLAAVREEMDRTKKKDQGLAFDALLQQAENAPAVFHALAGINGLPPGMINVVCTNVPGPLIPLYGSGRRMQAMYPLLPLTGDLGLGIAITSYDKSLYFGVISDPDIVPDVERITEFLDDEFARLREAAGVPESDLPDVGANPRGQTAAVATAATTPVARSA